MKSLKYTLSILLFVSLVFSNCRKDSDVPVEGEGTTILNAPIVVINATFDGIVKDESGNAIIGAEVTIGELTEVTNELGYYRIRTEANQMGTRIHVGADGYTDAYVNVVPVEDELNTFHFTLIVRNILPPFSSTTNSVVEFGEGHTIEFAANSIATASGAIYNGNVNIEANYYRTIYNSLFPYLPGDLYGVKENNLEVLVLAQGIASIELFDDNGGELVLIEPAELRLSIVDTLGASSNEELFAWALDDATSIWQESTTASIEDNFLVSEQTELGFLAIGRSTEFVNIELDLIGLPEQSQYLFQISNEIYDFKVGGTVNASHKIALKVPKNEHLLCRLDSHCYTIAQQTNINVIQEDGTYQVVFDLDAFPEMNALSGTAYDCNLDKVQNGIVLARVFDVPSYELIVPIVDGQYDLQFFQCPANIIVTYEIVAMDFDTDETSLPKGVSEADFRQGQCILACENPLENEVLKIIFENGEVYSISNTVVQDISIPQNPLYSIDAYDDGTNPGAPIEYFFLLEEFLGERSLSAADTPMDPNGFDPDQQIIYQFEKTVIGSDLCICKSEDFILATIDNIAIEQWDWSNATFSIDKGKGTIRLLSSVFE